MILSVVAAAVLANLDWFHHQAAFHAALIAYMAGNPHSLMVMIRGWSTPFIPISMVLYFYALAKSNGKFCAVDTLDKKVAEDLLETRRSRIRDMVGQEELMLKVNHTALKDGACRECNALRCY